MQWPFTKNTNRYALVGDRSRALLAVKNQGATGISTATPLGWADSPLSEAKSVHQVMANLSNPKGDVAISLPLDQFEILNFAVNKVPREVVAKILPYHISKVMDEPLSNFIYDWQIVKELKDSLQINVFLFPAKMFQELRNNLGHYKLRPTTLEPDVFSACAYLESRNLIQGEEATMIALLWPKSISIAIHDKENMVLTRNVRLKRPQPDHGDEDHHESTKVKIAAEALPPESIDQPSQPGSLFEPSPDDLLANFLIETRRGEESLAAGLVDPAQDDQRDEPESFNAPLESQPHTPTTAQNWPSYIHQVSLELMRTRDYFNSVVKGNQIKTVFVGGGEDAWQSLSAEVENSLGIKVAHLMDPEQTTIGDALFEAVSIGVLS